MPISIISKEKGRVMPDIAATQLFLMDVEDFLDSLPRQPIFDLVVTSPPYNIGKEYENQKPLTEYVAWQRRIIEKIYPRLKDDGSICWQVGNYVKNGNITPLDIELAPIFKELNLHLRNRIIWHYGHGLHNKKRFSGRYEVVMWYTKTDAYTFNLDDVRVPSKYPGKRSYRGSNKGQLSGNPKGKNPEDVWDIPNVKGNHVEKTCHPCQFPVGLIERLVLALTNEGDLVFDPFSGVASSGVAALLHKRNFWGCEIMREYVDLGKDRLEQAAAGSKGKGYMVWAERNNIDAKAQSIIYLKEHHIGSTDDLDDQIRALRSTRNNLHAAIREKRNRMKEINHLRQAIRDYRRTKDVYVQYKNSGWSVQFYNEHRQEIEAHKRAQTVYSNVGGKMPTLKEMTAEYDVLKAENERDQAALEILKPELATLHRIKHNIDILERDYLPEAKDLRRNTRPER